MVGVCDFQALLFLFANTAGPGAMFLAELWLLFHPFIWSERAVQELAARGTEWTLRHIS